MVWLLGGEKQVNDEDYAKALQRKTQLSVPHPVLSSLPHFPLQDFPVIQHILACLPVSSGGSPKLQSEMKGPICLRKLDTNKPGVNHQGQNYFFRLVTGFPTYRCPSPSSHQLPVLWVVGLGTNRTDEQGPKGRSQAAMVTETTATFRLGGASLFFNLLLNCCQHLHFLPELPGNPYEFSRGWCPSPSVTLSGKTTMFLWFTLEQMRNKACCLPGSH